MSVLIHKIFTLSAMLSSGTMLHSGSMIELGETVLKRGELDRLDAVDTS